MRIANVARTKSAHPANVTGTATGSVGLGWSQRVGGDVARPVVARSTDNDPENPALNGPGG